VATWLVSVGAPQLPQKRTPSWRLAEQRGQVAIPFSLQVLARRRQLRETVIDPGVSRINGPVALSSKMDVRMTEPIPLPTADGPSDAELVASAVGGHRWSREVLYRRYARSLLAIATRLLANRGDAEDVVQETFVIGFEQLATLREPAAVRGWLAQIAISLVHRRLRRGRLFRFLGLDRGADDATLETLAATGADAEKLAELALIDRQLGSVGGELRIAWMLRRVEGLELAEIATLCRCSLATAKRRVGRIDELMNRHLGGGTLR
jgi:RNA polymerase sigma-70 factor (ECF subfamily)